MSYANPRQPAKDYDVVIIPSRIADDFRWLYCANCGHKIIGLYVDKLVEADRGVYHSLETSYTVLYRCKDCGSLVRIVLASEVG